MTTSKVIRERIWDKLQGVARPDTRFHMNFSEVIPDFDGSEAATDRLVEDPAYQTCKFAFITPDNCLADLRCHMIEDGKPFVMSTYGIYRGFLFLDPATVPEGAARYASWLDGMEHFGQPITLREIAAHGGFDYLVTGASAVSENGVRFGKGHGFFDLEWGMFTELGFVDNSTPVHALVHDVQLVRERLQPSETDILVDKIFTPTLTHVVENRAKRPRGVKWDLVDPWHVVQVPPLQELRRLEGLA